MTVRKFTFPNGLRLVYEKSASSKRTSNIQVFCDVGSIHEPENLRGASHFIEHMCFKGTTHIRNFENIYTEYDEIGAYINASTDKRFTKYIVRCNTDYTENMLAILSDMILNSIFDKTAFKREEQVVIEENVMRDKDPSNQLYDGLDSMLYDGTNYANPVDSVDYHKTRFKRDEIIKFYKTFYQPNRIVISIMTQLPFDTIRRFVRNTYFAKTTNTNHIFPVPRNCPIPSDRIQYKIVKSVGTYVSVGFRYLAEDKYPMMCLGIILSGPMSSRLWKILRDDAGIAYGASAESNTYEMYGDFCIYSDTDKSKIFADGSKPGVLPLTMNLINDLIKNGINKPELDLAKGYLNGQNSIQSENDTSVSEYNGIESILFPDKAIVAYSKIFDTFYKNMSVEDINRCIRKYFRKEFMSVCITCDQPVKLANVKAIAERLVGQ
jgi:predicted Zn-dependent peptidase